MDYKFLCNWNLTVIDDSFVGVVAIVLDHLVVETQLHQVEQR